MSRQTGYFSMEPGRNSTELCVVKMKIPKVLILQAVVWISIWMIFAFTGSSFYQTTQYYVLMAIRVLGYALLFNIVYYALVPLYFAEKKRLFYGLSVLAFIGYIGFSVAVDVNFYNIERNRRAGTEMELPRNKPIRFLLIPPIVLGLVIFGAAATFRGFAAFETKKKAEQEANRRRLEAEIALMKSQINPHFLLNTLNNLYALSLSEPKKTPEAIYKLSEMVSYILHECASPKVALSRDLEFVRSYIELQRLRLPPNAHLKVALPSHLPENVNIEPMILIPFIENAFKHGLTTKKPCEICIFIDIEDDQLTMRVENMLLPLKESQVADPSGIGMTNTRQRLDHSYLGKHQLHVEKDGAMHRVKLQLDLAE